jgi:hypothetical protein
MPISSTTLFHYTKSVDALTGILENGFWVRHCTEYRYPGKVRQRIDIPMVCFCDIPISLINNHTKTYSPKGVFAIGMNRSWGEKKGINPVIYVPPKSYLSDILTRIDRSGYNFSVANVLEYLSRHREVKSILKKYPTLKEVLKIDLSDQKFVKENEIAQLSEIEGMTFVSNVSRLNLFVKPSIGNFQLSIDKVKKHYSYYNEREWRYVPKKVSTVPFIEEKIIRRSSKVISTRFSEYFDKIKREIFDNLTFSVSDISFIIVPDQKQVEVLIERILTGNFAKIGGTTIINDRQKYHLISSIISWERISSDILSV